LYAHLISLIHPHSFAQPNNIYQRVQIMTFLIMYHSPASSYFLPWVQIFSSTPCSQRHTVYVFPLWWDTKFHDHTKQRIKLECYMYTLIFTLYKLNTDTKDSAMNEISQTLCLISLWMQLQFGTIIPKYLSSGIF
jgi:hypothetical protein